MLSVTGQVAEIREHRDGSDDAGPLVPLPIRKQEIRVGLQHRLYSGVTGGRKREQQRGELKPVFSPELMVESGDQKQVHRHEDTHQRMDGAAQ